MMDQSKAPSPGLRPTSPPEGEVPLRGFFFLYLSLGGEVGLRSNPGEGA
jgi:hypothetical protein